MQYLSRLEKLNICPEHTFRKTSDVVVSLYLLNYVNTIPDTFIAKQFTCDSDFCRQVETRAGGTVKAMFYQYNNIWWKMEMFDKFQTDQQIIDRFKSTSEVSTSVSQKQVCNIVAFVDFSNFD